eukprot:gene20334-24395_t
MSVYGQLRGVVTKLMKEENMIPEVKDKSKAYQPLFTAVALQKVAGDYTIANTYQLSRMLGADNKSVVERLAKSLQNDIDRATQANKHHLLASVEVVGKDSFLNVFLSQHALESSVRLWCDGGVAKDLPLADPETHVPRRDVLVDFASPNMSKELHVGHLRSIALGESVCRILEYRGHTVERISHAGDFGTPMGMVIAHALDTRAPFLAHIWDPKSGATAMPYIPSPKELSDLYSAAKQRTKADAAFLKTSMWTAAELQKGPPSEGGSDPSVYQAWLDICEASRAGFNHIYKMMDVTVTERGESHYRTMLDGVLTGLRDKDMLTVSEGADCVFLKGQKTPVIVRKSDGASLYATTDLAAVKSRVANGKRWIVYITDDSQRGHFEQVFEIARLAGWLPSDVRVDHLAFGVVRGDNGAKLSSRDGNPLALLDLLNESIARAKQATVTARSLTRGETLSTHKAHFVDAPERLEERFDGENSQDHFARIGLGAIKYFDLAQRNNPYVFSFDRMLSIKGYTSVYVLYCYTRIATIIQRSTIDLDQIDIGTFNFLEFTEKERKMVLMIAKFPDTLKSTEAQLRPAVLCDYLWDLADSFHHFYEAERVIGSDRETQRLFICRAIQKIIKTGFQMLAIEPVERL